LVLALFPVAVVLPIALAGLTAWGASFTYEQLYIKVNTDLAVAHDKFAQIQQDHLDSLERLSESFRLREALARDDRQAIDRLIAEFRAEENLSYLLIRKVDKPSLPDDSVARVGIEVLAPEDLDLLSPELAAQTRLTLLETERARPTQRRVEERGMLIRAKQPVSESDGEIRYLLDGGVLLNRNFGFVDTIRDLVYGPGSLRRGSIGTVTVFLDDVRISTNVPRTAGERALGTRVSAEVSRAVLDAGKTWIDRAFVVNEWYISAYEPIIDIHGERVGILYAGYLEAPYRTALWQTLGLVLLILLGLMGLYALLAVRGAKRIFHPLERMSTVVHATRLGQTDRVGRIDSGDELAELAREFDAMLDRLETHAADMEQQVELRTAELRQRNSELERTITALRETRRQLVTAEKLAALGELTAGVAHEINNPTQVMLGNLDVIASDLGQQLEPVREDFELVIEQIYRIQAIIEKLLRYARPGDYAGHLNEIDVNQVVTDTTALVAHMRHQQAFELDLQLHATRCITINQQELQQVLVNLISNAVHALPPSHGHIVLAAEDWEERGVCISVTDNGTGMTAAETSRIFNPFYSTKSEGNGTGLGLSVSYGLIRRYGGNITVTSTPGQGTCFKVWLLHEPQFIADAETIAEQLHDQGIDATSQPTALALRRTSGL
jgi:two-component system NtrC family sensor kinase